MNISIYILKLNHVNVRICDNQFSYIPNQNLAADHQRGNSVCIIRMNQNLAADHRRGNSVCIIRMNQNLAADHRRGNSVSV